MEPTLHTINVFVIIEKKQRGGGFRMIIPLGISDFRDIRENGYYYVDKSKMIKELLEDVGTKVTLITRPRRFGKTLNMSMLAEFFDVGRDSRPLFEELFISGEKTLCSEWMNQYPTVFITFKSVTGLNFELAYGELIRNISELYKRYLFVLDSEKINKNDKEIFDRTARGEMSVTDVKGSLSKLTQILETYYGKQVILLIDEYDVPVAKANDNGYYEEMMDVSRSLLEQALKDNRHLKLAVMTGCLRIVKESIFTGLNNFTTYTIADEPYSDCFGFTQREVDELLERTALTRQKDTIRKWYDGYLFGNSQIYCPWDVTNYVRDLQKDRKATPKNYWENSSDNSIIESFLKRTDFAVNKKIEILLDGGEIRETLEENITYHVLTSSEKNLWSLLYMTGYLTSAERPSGENVPLRIPNLEILSTFRKSVQNWFHDVLKDWNRAALFEAVWSHNAEKATEEMSRLLLRTISYHDYKEDFYHAFLAGIFSGAGYDVESNREHGEGRSDVIVKDYLNDRVVIFEVKHSEKLGDLEADCMRALTQIKEKGYAEEFKEDYTEVLCYGVACCKKRCLMKSS